MTAKMTMVQALQQAMELKLKEDDRVILMGEDIGLNGGVFRVTDGLQAKFGEDRVIDTPLAESGIVGTAVGMALNGMIPVVEIQFLGFIYPGFEQVVSHVSRLRARTQGRYQVPMVIRTPYGAGIRGPELHSESVESFFVHVPGLKVVVPSTPYDAKGLLIAAIEDPDPVIFLEPTSMYRALKEEVPEDKYTVPLGKARVIEEGEDISIFAWGAMVQVALQAARKMKEQRGWTADVIDLRTLYPFDRDTIKASVEKTGRALIVHEAHRTGGMGAELISFINDESLFYLKAPVARVTGYDVPVPFFSLEDDYLPTVERVSRGIEQTITY